MIIYSYHDSPDFDGEDIKPVLTICMPIAITKENESTIVRALDAISAEQRKFTRPVTITLWANAK